jgi:hypothetical protein
MHVVKVLCNYPIRSRGPLFFQQHTAPTVISSPPERRPPLGWGAQRRSLSLPRCEQHFYFPSAATRSESHFLDITTGTTVLLRLLLLSHEDILDAGQLATVGRQVVLEGHHLFAADAHDALLRGHAARRRAAHSSASH